MLNQGMNSYNIATQYSGTPLGFQNHANKYYQNFLMSLAMRKQLPPEYFEVKKPEQDSELLRLMKQYRGGQQWA